MLKRMIICAALLTLAAQAHAACTDEVLSQHDRFRLERIQEIDTTLLTRRDVVRLRVETEVNAAAAFAKAGCPEGTVRAGIDGRDTIMAARRMLALKGVTIGVGYWANPSAEHVMQAIWPKHMGMRHLVEAAVQYLPTAEQMEQLRKMMGYSRP